MNSKTSHAIKHRETPNDKFYTPKQLSYSLIDILVEYISIDSIEKICDPCKGIRIFHPIISEWYEIDDGKDFFSCDKNYCWLVSNPPYSILDKWLEKSCDVATEGIAYLLAAHALTPKRMEYMESRGFYLSWIHTCKVFKWYGMSQFCVWLKKDNRCIVRYTYDRKVWR